MAVLIVKGEDAEEGKTKRLCEKLWKNTMGKGYRICTGIGSAVEDMQEIPFSYKTAKAALYEAQCQKVSQCFFERLPYSYQSASGIYAVELAGINNAVHLKESDVMKEETGRLVNHYQKVFPPYVVFAFVQDCAKQMLESSKEERKQGAVLYPLETAVDIENLLHRFEHLTEDFFESEDKKTEEGYKGTIDDVLRYIQLHYMGDISIEKICSVFYFNQSYFSVLFKGKTGINYNDYVTELRIKKAKALLKSGNYKIHEIAEMVGYNSARYFSRVFKAKTGELPQEYRARNSQKTQILE